jgi:4-aminobutyrate aminotransferase-like enzyme
MRTWADEHEALLISDEVQAGFCRTGKFLAFEHFNVPVDLVACGKGISSSLPLSAVLGRRELLDVDPSLNSTHGGNPVCCAAALANLEVMQRQSLAEIARKTGSIFGDRLKEIAVDYPEHIFTVQGRGFLWGVHMVNPETEELDVRLADEIVEKLMRKGMLIVRTGVGTLKFGPPLCISEDAIIEGVGVVQEVLAETIRARNRQGK